MNNKEACLDRDALIQKRRRLRFERAIKRGFVKFVFFVLLLGFAYVILYPFLFKITAAFMSREDLFDPLVDLIPRSWVLDNFKAVLKTENFAEGFFNMAFYALVVGILSTASAALVGYGLARYRFPCRKLVMVLVVLTMIVPTQTIRLSLFSTFRYLIFFFALPKFLFSLLQSYLLLQITLYIFLRN